jgi:hypothetical protein
MPVFTVSYEVSEMEGANRVFPLPSSEEFSLRFKLQCKSCNEIQSKTSVLEDGFNHEAKTDIPGGKGTASLVQKCGFCSSPFSLDVTSTESQIGSYSSETKAPAFLATLECRGCEPVEFEAGPGWAVEGSGGTIFNDVDLTSGDFCEFDEKSDASVTVSSIVGIISAGTGGVGKKGKK